MLETVAFQVAGRILPHESCTLRESAEEAVREASFVVPWAGAGIPCAPDEEAVITVSGDLWGTGYVRDVNASHGEEDRIYTVTFVSRTCDATECSVEHPTGLLKDVDITGIAEGFDTLGIGVESAVTTPKKPRHKLRPGETLFDTLETEARARGVLIHDTERGKLKLADRPEGRHVGALRLGDNIKQASATLSGEKRHSKVTVRGQAAEGTSGPVLSPEGEAEAPGLPRPRPLIIVHEGEITSERAKKRAAWEAQRGVGNGVSCTITVPGWRDAGGRLWKRNFLVEVDDDWLGISGDMVIASVTFAQDGTAEGTQAVISCKDPRALGGENPRGDSNAAWSAPAASEPVFRVN
ncbi:hypothetical protein [Afifella sp. IM 167]|uniref:phage baseplate assembly protein n=1 Tax=Afifella sp. IM 167 TaxID=2033586 RepID=UPI001CD013CB|nr:hypothetical protein [Afifella sp. IM 167]MBZ8133220.1 hypothetical protein [Afifella sp. IM 167]